MHIVSVELENIKRYTHDRFEFMLGTNAISGPNGAGKSTILEAIGFTLFDSLPYKKEDFLRRGATTGTVRVTFESGVDEREYTVVRNTKSTYYVFDPATKTRVAEQKADVLAWLREHLGVAPDIDLDEFFRTTIGVPQGTFTAIFMDTATRRKAVFDRILRVEEYRQSSDALKETQQHFQGRISEADKELASYQGRLLRMPDLEVQQAQLETERRSTEERLARSKRELGLWQGRLAEMDALEKAIAQDRRDREALGTKREYALKERDVAQARVTEAERAQSERQVLEADYLAYQAAETELSALQADLKARDALRTERAGVQRKLDEATFALQTLAARLSALAKDAEAREALRPQVEAQAKHEAALTELRTQLAEARATEERLARTRAEHRTWAERLSKIETELEALDALKGAPARVEQLAASLQAQEASLAAWREAELRRKERESRRKLLDEAAAKERRAVTAHAATLAAKEPLRKIAVQLDALTEQGQALRDRMATVEAELARDRKASTQFQAGNLCPILNVGCPILEGQSPDDYYRGIIAANEAKAEALNAEILDLRKRWKEASDASKQIATLDGVRLQHDEAKAALAKHEAALALIAKEDAEASGASGESEALSRAIALAREALSKAQAGAARYAQREGLAAQRDAVVKEQADRAAAIAADERATKVHGELAERLAAVEQELVRLGDPRSRDRALERAIAERPRLEAEHAKQESAAKEAATALAALDERLAPFADLDARLLRAGDRRKASESGYQRYLAVVGVADELEARTQARTEAIARLAALEAELAGLEAASRERSATYQSDEHASLRERIEVLKAETIRFEQAVGFLAQQLERTLREMSDLRRVQEEMKEAIAARERLVADASFVEFARATLKEAGPFITEAYLMNISLEADRLFREITGHHQVHLRWSNDYEILLEEEGRDRPFNNLSGGEQMAAALSVRLALLKETSSVDMAFFDEPTTNMDESRRSNLAHQIGEIRTFKQLFVISHDDTFEQWTDHVVRVAGR